MTTLGVPDIRAIVSGIAVLMAEKKEELIRLDGAMGDGDLGLTMEKGFSAAREEAEKTDEPDLGKFLMKIGMAVARAAPSTMGTLVATGFMSGGKSVMGKSALGGGEMADFFEAFTAGIMQRGKRSRARRQSWTFFSPPPRRFARLFLPVPICQRLFEGSGPRRQRAGSGRKR